MLENALDTLATKRGQSGVPRAVPRTPPNRLSWRRGKLSKDIFDLLTPGAPSNVPQEVWEQGSRDQYESDRIAEVAARLAEIDSSQQVSLKYTSKLKQQVLLALMEKADMKNQKVCEWLDSHWADDLPYGKPFIRAYEGKEQPLLQSLIGKVRADLRRSRRP